MEVRRAVLAGHRLRIHYAAVDQTPRWRTVDPIGLVTVRDQGYLLATRSDADRTYRLSRISAARQLAEPRTATSLRPEPAGATRCAGGVSAGSAPIVAPLRSSPGRGPGAARRGSGGTCW
ncbi:WYL domain-containing protein [Micromonospora sp. NPDC048063]|uniref:WYL domain-containing protein n=1 Tax=Micromonospora sp. NPDC048063 TaxID=3364256 RepID=UPI0037238B0A